MQQGSMSLEYIFKFIILLFVIGVIITLVLNFKSDISDNLCSLLGTCDGEQSKGCDTTIRKGNFDATEVAKLIKGCWSRHKDSLEDCVCYSMQGSFSATAPQVKQALTTEAKNHTEIKANLSQTQVVNIVFSLSQDNIIVK